MYSASDSLLSYYYQQQEEFNRKIDDLCKEYVLSKDETLTPLKRMYQEKLKDLDKLINKCLTEPDSNIIYRDSISSNC